MQDNPLKRFGERVRALRVRTGLSQEALAAQAGIHRTYMGGVERGERNISLRNIVRLAAALGVHPRDLFDEPEAQ
ncbi:MAG TPA: helix-turn-helix transcriptional regulator [Gemmataceae bacterium]|nr:helix-turn-helix transcriptional regulator [Gemmataceae bacterium]